MKLVSMGASLLVIVFIGLPFLVFTSAIVIGFLGGWGIPVLFLMFLFAIVAIGAKVTESKQ